MAKESIFVITIRVNFDTISKLGTYIYYIGGLRTDNGIGTIQYIPVYIYLYILRFYQNTLCPCSGMTF